MDAAIATAHASSKLWSQSSYRRIRRAIEVEKPIRATSSEARHRDMKHWPSTSHGPNEWTEGTDGHLERVIMTKRTSTREYMLPQLLFSVTGTKCDLAHLFLKQAVGSCRLHFKTGATCNLIDFSPDSSRPSIIAKEPGRFFNPNVGWPFPACNSTVAKIQAFKVALTFECLGPFHSNASMTFSVLWWGELRHLFHVPTSPPPSPSHPFSLFLHLLPSVQILENYSRSSTQSKSGKSSWALWWGRCILSQIFFTRWAERNRLEAQTNRRKPSLQFLCSSSWKSCASSGRTREVASCGRLQFPIGSHAKYTR